MFCLPSSSLFDKIVEISSLAHFLNGSGRCLHRPRLIYNTSFWAGFEIEKMPNSKSVIRLTWALPGIRVSSLTWAEHGFKPAAVFVSNFLSM